MCTGDMGCDGLRGDQKDCIKPPLAAPNSCLHNMQLRVFGELLGLGLNPDASATGVHDSIHAETVTDRDVFTQVVGQADEQLSHPLMETILTLRHGSDVYAPGGRRRKGEAVKPYD